ncbi:unnamed protein product [Spirodela intermedia]|uniref:Uncharacterized protein n=1 Tax=Spirodela intermedia TaxID=51605 RepID=A0A7I8KHC2_SPIIN|nr:unnamed protein product [Spirodela intermedia]
MRCGDVCSRCKYGALGGGGRGTGSPTRRVGEDRVAAGYHEHCQGERG